MTDDDLKKTLADRLTTVEARLLAACQRASRPRESVTLIAVTKTVSPRVAGLLPGLGVFDLGESRPQELRRKAAAIPDQIRWHMIGHLQRNKVEEVLPLAQLTHSVDSPRLLETVAAAGKKLNVRPRILLQVNASREDQKHGFTFEELPMLRDAILAFPGEVAGLMGMAAYADDPEAARPAFRELRELRDQLQLSWGRELPELSMGMSGDFEVAVEEGSTMVRIGSTLFEGLEESDG
ncbi:YggS family pyridoxal phosphate-dependent enzyme [Zavarzinella formosa]|uniref:YggS family pyridoxal phosphate-dependent enzyme n=1 Tax=Zavarzinella formosa TaxID=360055 RepID=UPI000593F4D7|nr:YggS family pyridoxal phosphate-dependent enzyme [Zavarzinella formosa]